MWSLQVRQLLHERRHLRLWRSQEQTAVQVSTLNLPKSRFILFVMNVSRTAKHRGSSGWRNSRIAICGRAKKSFLYIFFYPSFLPSINCALLLKSFSSVWQNLQCMMVVSKWFKRLLDVQCLLQWLLLESLNFVHCYYCISQSISVLVYLVLLHWELFAFRVDFLKSCLCLWLSVTLSTHCCFKNLLHSTASLPMITLLLVVWKNLSLGTDSFPLIIFLSFLHFSATMMSYYWVRYYSRHDQLSLYVYFIIFQNCSDLLVFWTFILDFCQSE